MAKNFEANFNLLTKELSRITKNINSMKNKNHDSISKIINNIKNINDNSTKTKLEKEKEKTNYDKIRPIIYLYPTYKNQKNIHSKTIDNITITNSKFFLDKNSIINIKKTNYKKAHTIDFNSNYNLNKSNSSKKIKTQRNKKNHIYNKNDISKILNFDYYNNKEFNKLNKKHINIPDDFFESNYNNYKDKYYKNYNSINVTKITRHNNYFRRNNLLPKKEKKFLNQMFKIYGRYNNLNKLNNNYEYDKIIEWINDLINKKGKEGKEEKNKYENFCKQLMKENNIKNFSTFQSFAKNNIKEEKSANYFIKDLKKILFKNIA